MTGIGGRISIGYERLDARHVPAQPADVFERHQRMLHVIQDAKEQHDIERAQFVRT